MGHEETHCKSDDISHKLSDCAAASAAAASPPFICSCGVMFRSIVTFLENDTLSVFMKNWVNGKVIRRLSGSYNSISKVKLKKTYTPR